MRGAVVRSCVMQGSECGRSSSWTHNGGVKMNEARNRTHMDRDVLAGSGTDGMVREQAQ